MYVLSSFYHLTLYLFFYLTPPTQDFRGAVANASQQNGKPVIEDHLLNQILYDLPQLYKLNQDLLRELKQRVAKWYDALCFYIRQLADSQRKYSASLRG